MLPPLCVSIYRALIALLENLLPGEGQAFAEPFVGAQDG